MKRSTARAVASEWLEATAVTLTSAASSVSAATLRRRACVAARGDAASEFNTLALGRGEHRLHVLQLLVLRRDFALQAADECAQPICGDTVLLVIENNDFFFCLWK